jgi:hypothetical protein
MRIANLFFLGGKFAKRVYLICAKHKSARGKTKTISIILTKPISINLVSNTTNKLFFHSQKEN